jgi:hypothetical protein
MVLYKTTVLPVFLSDRIREEQLNLINRGGFLAGGAATTADQPATPVLSIVGATVPAFTPVRYGTISVPETCSLKRQSHV